VPAADAVDAGVPHSPQNFWPSISAAPQVEHAIARRAPHSPQNLRPAGFSVPQLAQVTPVSSPS
jgi:hypothetical protein